MWTSIFSLLFCLPAVTCNLTIPVSLLTVYRESSRGNCSRGSRKSSRSRGEVNADQKSPSFPSIHSFGVEMNFWYPADTIYRNTHVRWSSMRCIGSDVAFRWTPRTVNFSWKKDVARLMYRPVFVAKKKKKCRINFRPSYYLFILFA